MKWDGNFAQGSMDPKLPKRVKDKNFTPRQTRALEIATGFFVPKMGSSLQPFNTNHSHSYPDSD